MEPAGYGSYLPDLPVSETTETSKEERDQSMSGNVSKSGAAARWRAQSKVCMVKAVLPESQFPVAKGLAVANAADTLRHAGQIAPGGMGAPPPLNGTSFAASWGQYALVDGYSRRQVGQIIGVAPEPPSR